jgi:adenosylmethionine-8-amino-7-oxononanoate aminotransferase
MEDSIRNIEQADKRYIWHPFTQQQSWEAEAQIVIERAEGSYLIDIHGKRYLDGISSLWVNVHGHRRREINQAILDQLERVAHTTFLGLKMAYQYWQQCALPQPRKTKFFVLNTGYYSDTVGAMSLGGMSIYQQVYRPLLFSFLRASSADCHQCSLHKPYLACQFVCLEEVERVIAEHAAELAAVVMEPLIQGAAGMVVYPAGYTRKVWEIAKRHQVLFIVDEVATGFGKTGKMFACEHEGIEPDLMALGKGITGGYLPLAVTLATEQIYRAFLGAPEEGRTFYHGHAYTGNPVCCASALASLDLFEQDQTLALLQPKIAFLQQQLELFKQLPLVGEIRQCGFMVGIELVQGRRTRAPFSVQEQVATRVVKEARSRGVIIRSLSEVLVLMPSLAITHEELGILLQVTYDSICTIADMLQ